ncbi:MAG: TonB family protein [Erythrobacter sp.]|uniref:energy transducer TonB n=1 Tax=Erythrobacter sp. TaxID=1042 RepID=UPI0032EB47BB
MSARFHLAAMCALFASASLMAQEPDIANLPDDVGAPSNAVKLAPLGPWNIDFGDNRCRLTGLFGTEENRHLLLVEQAAPSHQFGLTLAGPEIDKFYNAPRLALGLRDGEPMRESDGHGHGMVEGFGSALIFTSLDIADEAGDTDEAGSAARPVAATIDLDAAAKSERIVIARGDKVVSFETGNLAEPLQAMNVCTTDLLTHWGLDAEKHRAYVPPEWTNQEFVVRRILRTYPDEALRRGDSAIFRMRVIVGTDGRVEDCHLEQSTAAPHFTPTACREMQRARFEPARDTEGAAMRSFYATSITYAVN